jgi:hypothetical protein
MPDAIAARNAIRTPRAAAVAGIIFAVLLSTALVLVRVAVPADHTAADDWLADGGRRTAVVIAMNLLPFAGIAFLWFMGVVRDRIGAGEDRLFATVFMGSGLLFVALLLVSAATAAGLLFTAEEPSLATVQPAIWAYGRRITHTLLSVYSMRMAAVFIMSTTTISLRLGLLPRWLTVLGFSTAGLLLVTAGSIPWFELLFPAWVLIFSVHILVVTMRRAELTSTER